MSELTTDEKIEQCLTQLALLKEQLAKVTVELSGLLDTQLEQYMNGNTSDCEMIN